MMLRLLHFLTAHKYRVASCVFNKALDMRTFSGPDPEAAWIAAHGFTEVLFMCECGARSKTRLLGDHTGLKYSTELSELERMARL